MSQRTRCYSFVIVLLTILGGFLYTCIYLAHRDLHDSAVKVQWEITSENNPGTSDTIEPTVKDAKPSTSDTGPPTHDDTHSTPSHATVTAKPGKDHEAPKSIASANPTPFIKYKQIEAGKSNNNLSKSKTADAKRLAKILASTNPNNIALPQLDEILNTFGLIDLNSSKKLKVEFLKCSVRLVLQRSNNKHGGVLHIPKHFQTCKNMTFKRDGESVALISTPGSGNSWVRQLLETTTGIYTGSVFCDPSYVHNAGMMGEGIDTNNVLLFKIHEPPKNWNLPDKILFVVRNPFDAYVAEWNRASLEQSNGIKSHVGFVSLIDSK